MPRLTVAQLAEQVSQLTTRVESLERRAQPKYRMLVVNGVERFASQDYAYLSQVAKKTKLAHPSYSVQIH